MCHWPKEITVQALWPNGATYRPIKTLFLMLIVSLNVFEYTCYYLGYQGLSDEAPPSYDDIINTDRVRQAPIPRVPVPQFPILQYVTPVSPMSATDFTPLNPQLNPNVNIVTSEIPTTLSQEELGCWCYTYGQKYPTMTGNYTHLHCTVIHIHCIYIHTYMYIHTYIYTYIQ